ncbi:MAG: hypothetical protein IPM51_12765 [Sphingobacteriaceae bacterium]|nr:hypothetical protein [Sphingobacteriaceae bacterium]
MILERTLNRIQAQINDLAPTLELFVEEKIQPTVHECETLQKLLVKLQEDLAVYTYHKREKDISPSFNIHAKVSKQEDASMPTKQAEPEVKNEGSVESKIVAAMSIGVNDKFRIINELFKQNSAEYNIAVEQIGSLVNWTETELYLNSLKSIYGWKDNSEVMILFYNLAKKRFL